MTTTNHTDTSAYSGQVDAPRRLTTETKSAFKTTELIVFVLSVVGVLIAAAVTDNGDDGQGFGARSAWLYVTLLSIGYMISRGLAKAGSRERYDACGQRSTRMRAGEPDREHQLEPTVPCPSGHGTVAREEKGLSAGVCSGVDSAFPSMANLG